jgi:hypothetical protein
VDVYHIFCNLKPGVHDLDFVRETRAYLDHLKSEQRIRGYRILRAKLGLRPPQLREFHLMLEFDSLAQLDRAFEHVASRAHPVESFHHAVNSKVQDVFFSLYRDFPDPVRVEGQERF